MIHGLRAEGGSGRLGEAGVASRRVPPVSLDEGEAERARLLASASELPSRAVRIQCKNGSRMEDIWKKSGSNPTCEDATERGKHLYAARGDEAVAAAHVLERLELSAVTARPFAVDLKLDGPTGHVQEAADDVATFEAGRRELGGSATAAVRRPALLYILTCQTASGGVTSEEGG